MKKIVIFIYCALFFSYVYGQTALDYYSEGRYAQNREDWYTATELYLEALNINPAYGDAWFSLAECAYELDQYDLALNYIVKSEQYIKNRVEIPNLKGFSLIGLGRLDEARQIFLEILITQPNNVDARFGLAQLDLFNGKFTGAENYFLDALKRESSNKKALLSLALIADEMGDTEKAQDYILQALRYHNERADVLYIAGYLAAKANNLRDAESYTRTAISIDENYEDAYKMLSDILFVAGRYDETISVCDRIIAMERDTPSAWYVKGLANAQLGNINEALSNWELGLRLDPQDELMRAAFELLIYDKIQIEDSRRTGWAAYHLEKAQIAREKYLSSTALYEYQRTLRIDPVSVPARLALADILLQEGYAESYLSQLQFLQAQNLSTQSVDDNIESYSSLLSNTLPLQWGVDPFYLDKTRWSIALYHFADAISMYHQNALSITSGMLADIFNSNQTVEAIASEGSVKSYAEAFRDARENEYDFFAMLDVTEGERDIRINIDLYLASTGTKVASWDVYRTGNDRFASALQKIRNDVTKALPQKGSIIQRRGTNVLIDMGRKDGASVDQVFEIYEEADIQLKESEIALKYDTKDMLGTITLTSVGEDISQGVYKQNGFYDVVNIGDEIIPVPVLEGEDSLLENTVQVVAEEVSEAETQSPEVNIEKQTSILYELIQGIR